MAQNYVVVIFDFITETFIKHNILTIQLNRFWFVKITLVEHPNGSSSKGQVYILIYWDKVSCVRIVDIALYK
jgi:hypothetical protein